ncbi:hypothetical protein B0T26DRAFT_647799 [Lasiosphaeria miniovina]|uniref:18S rRNA factor 2 n=1 Tax=Lasiosphaeria miniovina TaxID=1954250 RepID=A0AA40ALE2_9PEZI|nr:uncharacterized protein B0T26DRAFT_647799 [Lasiosphaeria miniovina]KAK0718006.1 hypothetical protein B0T26DRAFT_647799 [Lasiosphaeria miniovina]
MSAENRSHFLDAGDSEDDVSRGYDSDEDLQKGGRSAKRRRVEDDDDDDEGSDAADFSGAESDQDDDAGAKLGDKDKPAGGEEEQQTGKDGKPKADAKKKKLELPGISQPLKKNLVSTEAGIKKSGVAYISRVPPMMKPAKLRSLLEPYGTINRIFLTPEDPLSHTRRVRNGGNKKRSYTEGWVEFVSKKDAKKACEFLNGNTIGGKKGSYYRDDLWNLIYLKSFKWRDLTEQIASENAERSSRMRAEISKTTKENKLFVQHVEKAKMLDGMQTKAAAKRKKAADEDGSTDVAGEAAVSKTDSRPPQASKRTFKQVPLAKKRKQDEQQPEQVQRVLSKIF